MSSLLERVIIAHRCRSTHHYIAIEALGQLSGDEADRWRDLLLVHHEALLEGAKAPDTKFKDFQNHVLHISEGEWGGARTKAMEWYGNAVLALKAKKWERAAYALGVLSHYYADPIQPFHTGQTEEEGAIHRALEWSVAKSRETIRAKIDERGYPQIKSGDGPGFVSDMVRAGAERSHPHYQTLIDHYDLDAGVKTPEAGLDDTLVDIFADLIAYATAGFATLVSRAVTEAGVSAPKTNLTVSGYLATLDIPVRWITKKLADAGDRRTVERMYAEFQKTGKVIKTLPADDKAIRKMHAQQVRRISEKELDAEALKPLGTKHTPRDISDAVAPAKPDQAAGKRAKAEKAAADKAARKAQKAAEAERLATEKAEKAKAREAAKVEKAAAAQAAKAAKVAAAEAEKAEKAAAAEAAKAEKAEAEKARKPAKASKTTKASKKKAKAKTSDAQSLPAVAGSSETTVAKPASAKDLAGETGDTSYVDEETWIEPDDKEIAAIASAQTDTESDTEAADGHVDIDAEIAALDGLTDEERAELEAQLEAELQAEIDAEMAREDAEDIEEEIATEEAKAEESAKETPHDDSHWRQGSLTPDSAVVEAPSIGRKTAERLGEIGVFTVGDLLEADADVAAELLDVPYITEDTLIDWQDQAELMMTVPGLRTHDAQVLVGAGIRSADELANAAARDIFIAAMDFLSTPEGDRIVRDEDELEEDEIEHWIDLARSAA